MEFRTELTEKQQREKERTRKKTRGERRWEVESTNKNNHFVWIGIKRFSIKYNMD